jgi:S-adenosylmethionine-diacylglycerol 3-amino-3-carboxypropyl transferase
LAASGRRSARPGSRLKQTATLTQRIDQKVFGALYARSLVYNCCWEDPAVDRLALNLQPDDTLLVITSAGCNALDYALLAPRRVHAVDANPRQTALLELKIAGIRRLEFSDFFLVFGAGRHPRFHEAYCDMLRADLFPFARAYWDKHGSWFCQPDERDTFYYFGLSGTFARAFRGYLRLRPRLREGLGILLAARSLNEQRAAYDERVEPVLWGRHLDWALSRQLTMNMLGVPHPQRREVERQHVDGIPGFIREAIRYVGRQIPIWTNYFWQLYLRGSYTRACCPEYLKRESFLALKAGLVERIVPQTSTVTEFLQHASERFSKFVLLDHMDWMSSFQPAALVEEWDAILARAARRARIIFRSAHAEPDYLAPLRVRIGSEEQPLMRLLKFHPELAHALALRDRVHTYAGFHIADLALH